MQAVRCVVGSVETEETSFKQLVSFNVEIQFHKYSFINKAPLDCRYKKMGAPSFEQLTYFIIA